MRRELCDGVAVLELLRQPNALAAHDIGISSAGQGVLLNPKP